VGLEVARRIGAEIISMDSMALYRGMDIGTAKPSRSEQAGTPHHLIDVLEPHEEYSLAQFIAAADRAANEIRARGRAALFVGGTPLYLKGLLRGIFQGPRPIGSFAPASRAGAERSFGVAPAAGGCRSGGGTAAPSQRHAAVDPGHRSL